MISIKEAFLKEGPSDVGNMVKNLNVPKDVAELFDKKYGSIAYAALNFFIASEFIRHYSEDEQRDFWKDKEQQLKKALQRFFEYDDTFEKLKAIKDKNPNLIKQLQDPNKRLKELDNIIKVALKDSPDDAILRAKKEGLVASDGYFWIPITEDECDAEGYEMDHCATDERGQLWSLRDKRNKPHVTLTYNKEKNTVFQVRGKQNKEPERKYWKYIDEFFKNKNVQFIKTTADGWDDVERDGFDDVVAADWAEWGMDAPPEQDGGFLAANGRKEKDSDLYKHLVQLTGQKTENVWRQVSKLLRL